MHDAPIPPPLGLTLRSVTTRGVRVPLTFRLGTSAAVVSEVPLLLVDILTEQGVVGRTYLFCYTPAGLLSVAGHLAEAVELAKGLEVEPLGVATMLSRRIALPGAAGPVRMALSALDMALWDALAVAQGRPLATLLGARPRPIPAYDSRGLGLMDRRRLADEAAALLGRA